jgi:hypothetical protein
MPSLLKSRKAQFFVLSAFAIVSVIYFVSKWMEPYTIIDTSSVVLVEEPFVFNNIVEKAEEAVRVSKSCDDLKYNIEEYSNFVQDFAFKKNYKLVLVYDYVQCLTEPFPTLIKINVQLTSTRIKLERTSFVLWPS